MSKWEKVKLKNIIDFPPKVDISRGRRYPYIEMGNINPASRYATNVTEKVYYGSGTKFENGDILFARITPCLENRKIVQANINGVGFGSTEFFVFRTKKNKVNQEFLYYLSITDLMVKNAINSYVGASGRQRADYKYLRNISLSLPPLPIQKKIAAVLSAYDDLIENNNRRIAILEKTAEEIYREWFVRMRFPGHEKATFHKGVPEGWEIKKLNEFCMLKRGYDLPDSKIKNGRYPVIASTTIKTFHNEFKVEPPVITTGRSGSLGTVIFTNQKAWPLNTSLYVKHFYGNSPYLIFYTLRSLKLENFNAGAGVPTLNRNHLSCINVPVPPKKIQNVFDNNITPIFEQKGVLGKANKKIKKTRDLLLSRLISGKLSVENLDIKFPPSMEENKNND